MQEELVENFYKAVNFLKVKLDKNVENFRKEYRKKYRQLYVKYEEERILAENFNINNQIIKANEKLISLNASFETLERIYDDQTLLNLIIEARYNSNLSNNSLEKIDKQKQKKFQSDEDLVNLNKKKESSLDNQELDFEESLLEDYEDIGNFDKNLNKKKESNLDNQELDFEESLLEDYQDTDGQKNNDTEYQAIDGEEDSEIDFEESLLETIRISERIAREREEAERIARERNIDERCVNQTVEYEENKNISSNNVSLSGSYSSASSDALEGCGRGFGMFLYLVFTGFILIASPLLGIIFLILGFFIFKKN